VRATRLLCRGVLAALRIEVRREGAAADGPALQHHAQCWGPVWLTTAACMARLPETAPVEPGFWADLEADAGQARAWVPWPSSPMATAAASSGARIATKVITRARMLVT
jgi:hypothetical protein